MHFYSISGICQHASAIEHDSEQIDSPKLVRIASLYPSFLLGAYLTGAGISVLALPFGASFRSLLLRFTMQSEQSYAVFFSAVSKRPSSRDRFSSSRAGTLETRCSFVSQF